jgi:hypothetical protein
MAGTIVTDRIESDASFASKIELASPVLVSNTFAVKSTGGTGIFNIVGANTNTDRTLNLPDNAGDILTSTSDLAGVTGVGKVLQVVRATDTTNRSTTSTSLVDVTGMSVTITPKKNNSSLIVIAAFVHTQLPGNTETRGEFSITDSSDVGISGAERLISGSDPLNAESNRGVVMIGYVTPNVTTALTYKLRFLTRNTNSTNNVANQLSTGQMYAIEVAA